MFGYVAAKTELLTEEEKTRYKEYYCGLCRSLMERHGASARLTLTYDMTFLVIVLSSMYEPDEECGEGKCPVHPVKGERFRRSEISDYAADMNIALAYLKKLDDWHDDLSLTSLGEAKLMKKSYEKVSESYPRQCSAMEQSITELTELEKNGIIDPDAASRCFGRLMAELFVWKEDRWSDTFREFGMALGQFIYIMDACIDLRDDKRYYKYNPFIYLFNRTDECDRFKCILEMLLGDCVRSFERVPLLQDVGLIRNILCFGVWSKFNEKYKLKE